MAIDTHPVAEIAQVRVARRSLRHDLRAVKIVLHRELQSFFGIMQMAMMPMMFLSGALFPLSGLPGWLSVLTRVNPLTYAVDPLRHVVFSHIDANPALLHRFNPGVTWFGWQVPPGLEVVLVLVMGVALLGVGIAQFRRTD